jgi:porphobilinogen synthase
MVDRERAIAESIVAIRRAGAQIVLTYWATEVAQSLT